MERRPIVLLDCDGILADFVKTYLTWLNSSKHARSSKPYQYDEISEFDIGKALGLRDEVWIEFATWLNEDESRLQFDVLPGAKEAVAELKEFCDVVVLTSPLSGCDLWVSRRNSWLKKHFGITKDDTFHGSRKELVRGRVLVDDRTENIVKWAEENPDGWALLFDHPWNRENVGWPENVRRVYGWSHAVRTVREVTNG